MYEIFEQLLLKYGLTAYQVSKATGIPQSTLSTWKAKRNRISNENAEILCRYFGISLDQLMGVNKEENESEFQAKNDTERKVIMLCRKVGDAPQEERDAIISQFESTIDMYLKLKGIKKGED